MSAELQSAIEPVGAPPTKPSDAQRSKRRRLWQLPTQAHELLLAMSFTPDWLRREAARTLGQIHKGRCVMKGRDVDVLYSVVHDMVTRNPLAEAMQKHLDARHAQAMRQVSPLKDAAALQAAWTAACAQDTAPAALWAVLTHPLGEGLESTVLYDARQWVFEHARRSVGQVLSLQATEVLAEQARLRAEQLQCRLLAQQQQAADALQAAQAEIVRLRGELSRKPVLVQPCQVASPLQRSPAVKHRSIALTSMESAAAPVLRRAAPLPDSTAQAPAPAAAVAAPTAHAAQPPVAIAGRRVLCVGGIQHAVARYRGRVETLGGRFDHHDGGLEDSVQALDARLNRADIVICQAACINHEAYHRVKRHCARTGTPCVYLDRPSLSRFDRALQQTAASVA